MGSEGEREGAKPPKPSLLLLPALFMPEPKEKPPAIQEDIGIEIGIGIGIEIVRMNRMQVVERWR